ncbi:FecR domain-containing protein [Colwellia sp. KU-HH00111]|uniref:FecR family protein n=1 Tax=Colwellia sp. KU-HH00111 TaxID=3127652 RepID=UPI0031099FE8
MSNIHHIHKPTIIDDEESRVEEACDWLAKIERGLTEQEKPALHTWLSLTSKNTEVLLEVAHLWDKMGVLSRLSDLFPQTPPNTSKKYSTWLGALAASVVFAITLGFYQNGFHFSLFGQAEQSAVVASQMNFQTGIGESNTINLPDNSKIVLNTNSFVQVRYTNTARIIDLQRGEIHIDVAHDKTRPLSVIASGKVIQAVGTAFNVEVRNDLVELIVTDGKVLVAQRNKTIAQTDINEVVKRLPHNSMAISKGEKVDLDSTGNTIEKVVKVDPVELAASLSWRQGNLIFRGESLAEAMAEISRYTNLTFELSDDEQLHQVQVAGMFKTGDVTGLLEVLSNNFNITYKKIANDKIVLHYAG